MAKSKVYLNKARDFAASALLANDAGRRAALLQIAQHWRDLANIVEKHAAGGQLARSLGEDPDRSQSKRQTKPQVRSQTKPKRRPDR